MCVGLIGLTGSPLVDLNEEPWCKLKKKDIKPTLKCLINEVGRRSQSDDKNSDDKKKPRSKNWNAAKCTEWLVDNPIKDPTDVSFIKKEVDRFKMSIVAAVDDEENQASGQWRGAVPYLRLILCLTEDDIKPKFIRRGEALSRTELDARNSETREPTVYEMIADRWNDPEFNPVLPSSNAHSDFQSATDCSFSKVNCLQPATAVKITNYLSEMRSNLIRIITNWEQSGQGDSGLLPESTTTTTANGTLIGRTAAALDSRANFLLGKPSYLLILWEVADQHHILSSTLQRLSVDVGASDACSTPSVITMHRGPSPLDTDRSGSADRSGSLFTSHLEVFSEKFATALAERQDSLAEKQDHRQEKHRITARLSELHDQCRQFCREKFLSSSNPETAEYFQSEIDLLEIEIESLKSLQRENERTNTV
jgi:hypothetical protein